MMPNHARHRCSALLHLSVLLWVALVGCAERGRVDAPAVPEQDSVGTAEASVSELQGRIDALTKHVSEVRKLSPKGRIMGRTIDRVTMLEQMKERLQDELPSDAIRGEAAFLSAFGFVPLGFDYEGEFLRMMENQLAGYYDPSRKSLFVLSDMTGVEAEATLVHELVHALQDQHFDLGPRLKYRPDAGDRLGATQCLGEGDAMSAMIDVMGEDGGRSSTDLSNQEVRLMIEGGMAMDPAMASFPTILRRSLTAPYVDGLQFVNVLRRHGGWSLVDEVWRSPPTTTEQVLHVEKWWSREVGEDVEIPVGPVGDGWAVLHSDVYGEQGVRLAFEEWMPFSAASKAAAGWAGDRAVVWEHRDSGVTVAAWRIRFDRAGVDGSAEAREAFGLLADAWGRNVLGRSAGVCRSLGEGRLMGLSIRGREVVFATDAGAAGGVGGSGSLGEVCEAVLGWASRIVSSR